MRALLGCSLYTVHTVQCCHRHLVIVICSEGSIVLTFHKRCKHAMKLQISHSLHPSLHSLSFAPSPPPNSYGWIDFDSISPEYISKNFDKVSHH